MHCPQGGGEEEEGMEEGEKEGGEEGEVGEGAEGGGMTEIRLVPQDPDHCESVAALVTF